MGLDMYLYASQHISSMFAKEKDIETIHKIPGLMGADAVMSEIVQQSANLRIQLEIAYWRKANAIHQFFVNLAGGKDDCRDIYVSYENLQDLVNRCEQILENKDVEKAKELLPTQSGFFFGSTEYDDWYFETLADTKETLSKILKNSPDDWDFYYCASW